MTKHEWHEITDSGEKRYVRALYHAGHWTFEDTLQSDPEWTPQKSLPIDDLRRLREILWKKYQRGRLPHAQVTQIEAMIAEAET
jgi:hypothetical protein